MGTGDAIKKFHVYKFSVLIKFIGQIEQDSNIKINTMESEMMKKTIFKAVGFNGDEYEGGDLVLH